MPDPLAIIPPIDPVTIFVTWDASDPEDDQWGREFAERLSSAVAAMTNTRLAPEDQPMVKAVGDFSNIPTPEEMGALSVIVLSSPDRAKGFSAAAAAKLNAIMQATPQPDTLEGRVLPIARVAGRMPPPSPIGGLVGLEASDASDAKVNEIARTALIHASLALASRQGGIFISYALKDGKLVATALEQQLKARGYNTWRDEQQDRDGMSFITPGSPAQKTIEKGILDRGFVLLIDTPVAATRPWVKEEVRLAFGYLLPILPIVVRGSENDPSGDRGEPAVGGRFRSVASLGREVRLDRDCLTDADAANQAVASNLALIEAQFATILLGHFRSRRRLLHEARRRFDELRFAWLERVANRLLFEADRAEPKPDAPSYRRVLIVGCAPYGQLIREAVDTLCDCHDAIKPFDALPKRSYQGAILVHGAVTRVGDYEAAGGGRTYLRMLRPHEITEDNLR